MRNELNINGRWVNQNGSTLVIDDVEGGHIVGRFESKKGRAAKGIEYPVAGLQNGELVSFQVSFISAEENLHAITSFAGRWESGSDGIQRIHTTWILSRQFEDNEMQKPTQVWNTFLTNGDVFTRIE
jgi:hypothetical protein